MRRLMGIAFLSSLLALGVAVQAGSVTSAAPADAPPTITAITAGFSHTCALTTRGSVLCWGRNEYGALGNGTRTSSSVPVEVSGLASGVTSISAGAHHTCALTRGGVVKCWGNNGYHQLGNGTTEDGLVPGEVPGLSSGVIAIAAGIGHTCALMSKGRVTCWGDNEYGQLGDGATTSSSAPVEVTGLPSGVRAISTGGYHTCALTTAGSVVCWGNLLGSGTPKNSLVPVEVAGLASGVTAISAGMVHTCALTNGGVIQCWGDNAYRQLGEGSTTGSSVPVQIAGLASGVTAIAAGSAHTCALTDAGGVKCWGYNGHGALGVGTATVVSVVPVDVSGLASGVTAIAAGASHACALMRGGSVLCWGFNYHGQLGNGTTADSSVPVGVAFAAQEPEPTATARPAGPLRIISIAAGGSHTCALAGDGRVLCWGANWSGQLGDGTQKDSSVPVEVAGLPSGVSAITASTWHTCALTSAGEVWCWGSNQYLQLGSGAALSSSVPVRVSGLASGVRAIAAGGSVTCALTAQGAVKCWGLGGRLGDGTARDSSVPVAVSGLASGVRAIAAASFHTCVLTGGGGVECWGMSSQGQLGNGTTASSRVPVAVSGLESGVRAIFTGFWHTCAVMTGGALKCWGVDADGEFGDGRTTNSSVPVEVRGLASGLRAFTGGGSHTCALTAEGKIDCWGDNGLGQLGDGTTRDSSVPVEVRGLTDANTAITAGLGHTCALSSDGLVTCWGDNAYGQLGNGSKTMSRVPVGVAFATAGTPQTSTAGPGAVQDTGSTTLIPLLVGLIAGLAMLTGRRPLRVGRP